MLVNSQVSAEHGNTLVNITPSLAQVRAAGSSSLMPPVPLASIISPPRTYATYQGSLTTPPCSEGVTWLISGYSIPASRQQVMMLPHVNTHAIKSTLVLVFQRSEYSLAKKS
jgi:carbonic anhydrase